MVGSCGTSHKDVKLRDIIIAMGASTDSNCNRMRFGGYDLASPREFDQFTSSRVRLTRCYPILESRYCPPLERKPKPPHAFSIYPVALLLAIAGCSNAEQPVPIGFEVVGALEHSKIREASGLAPSRRQSGLLWIINDNGAKEIVHAIDGRGHRLGEFQLKKSRNRDWEDLASFRLDETPYLMIADIGDNEARRNKRTLYFVEEPLPEKKADAISSWKVDFQYPGGPRDAESAAVDIDKQHGLLGIRAAGNREQQDDGVNGKCLRRFRFSFHRRTIPRFEDWITARQSDTPARELIEFMGAGKIVSRTLKNNDMATKHMNAALGDFADTVLMPGDPLRAQYIADTYLDNAQRVTDVRNMWGYTGEYKGRPVSVMSHGMGIPSASIYCTELIAEYGVKRVIRVGSCGTSHKDVKLRDIIIAMGASTDSNCNRMRLQLESFDATRAHIGNRYGYPCRWLPAGR